MCIHPSEKVLGSDENVGRVICALVFVIFPSVFVWFQSFTQPRLVPIDSHIKTRNVSKISSQILIRALFAQHKLDGVGRSSKFCFDVLSPLNVCGFRDTFDSAGKGLGEFALDEDLLSRFRFAVIRSGFEPLWDTFSTRIRLFRI